MEALAPHQQRVVDEKKSLDKKISDLASFTCTETFDGLEYDERKRLLTQLGAMTVYSQILSERITNFK